MAEKDSEEVAVWSETYWDRDTETLPRSLQIDRETRGSPSMPRERTVVMTKTKGISSPLEPTEAKTSDACSCESGKWKVQSGTRETSPWVQRARKSRRESSRWAFPKSTDTFCLVATRMALPGEAGDQFRWKGRAGARGDAPVPVHGGIQVVGTVWGRQKPGSER